MTAARDEAIAIFRELGWDGASLEQTPDLPIGTPEQQRRARAGLKSGDWSHLGEIGPRSFGFISDIPVDPALLGIFAIRVGVGARRALAVAPSMRSLSDDLLLRILVPRGPAFAAEFIQRACLREWRNTEFAPSPYGVVGVRLSDHHALPVPEHVGYLLDWAVVAAWVLGEEAHIDPPRPVPFGEGQVGRRFAEHVRVAVAVGVSATGPLGTLIPAGVRRGWLARDEALALSFAALDSAARPMDRKAWARVVTEALEVTDAELVERADLLVGVLATGEAPVVEAFAPRLIAAVPDDLVEEVVATALMARTKKAVKAVQVAAAARGVEPEPEEPRQPAEARDRWRATPPLWEVPRFEVGDATTEALTDAVAVLVARQDLGMDLEAERFLVLANEVARQDPEGARRALRGVPDGWEGGLRPVAAWVAGEPLPLDEYGMNGPVYGRVVAVLQSLGELPCLLSTPTWEDLRIHPDDLIARLRSYAAAGIAAEEADLLLAILRADLALVTPAVLAELGRLKVAVRLPSGKHMKKKAGALACAYFVDPLVAPELVASPVSGSWHSRAFVKPASLADFPRWQRADHHGEGVAIWGHLADIAAWQIGGNQHPPAGSAWRQLVRRSAPLTGGAAINLLAAQRETHPRGAADRALAVTEAWERGLLLPGVPDVTYLDWRTTPTNVASLVVVLLELADEGMASVVWSVLDDLLSSALAGARMAAGTAEVAAAMRDLAPEALAAVASGVADESALAVPGLRALAARPGKSLAVVAAREAAELLPPVDAPAAPPAPEPEPVEVDLDAVWPVGSGDVPAVHDGVTLTVHLRDPSVSTKLFAFDLVLPHRPDHVQRIVDLRTYDLDNGGTCHAYERRAGEKPPMHSPGGGGYLYWDGTRLEAVAGRGQIRGPLTSMLSTSIVTVAVGLAAQDGDQGRVGERVLEQLVMKGRVGSAAVRVAMDVLLTQPEVSPARLVRVLEKRPHLLPALWPLLTEPIRAAGLSAEPPPRWLNQVLVVATLHAPVLRAASRAGRLPAEVAGWPGLAELAARKGKSAALDKARHLQSLLS